MFCDRFVIKTKMMQPLLTITAAGSNSKAHHIDIQKYETNAIKTDTLNARHCSKNNNNCFSKQTEKWFRCSTLPLVATPYAHSLAHSHIHTQEYKLRVARDVLSVCALNLTFKNRIHTHIFTPISMFFLGELHFLYSSSAFFLPFIICCSENRILLPIFFPLWMLCAPVQVLCRDVRLSS